jgi:hypothetical protein
MEAKCRRFAEWLGHDHMARVGFENCRDYRDATIDAGDLSSGSILNHLKLLKALFTYAFDNEHITTNPMARIKYSAGDRKERDDFTPEERKLILILARKAEPHVYWVNWVCSFLGNANFRGGRRQHPRYRVYRWDLGHEYPSKASLARSAAEDQGIDTQARVARGAAR